MRTIKKASFLNLFGLLFAFIAAPSLGQGLIRCPHDHMETAQEEHEEHFNITSQQLKTLAGQSTNATETIYKIPIVVHIVHHNADNIIGGTTNDNISVAQIESQIAVLNQDFRRTNPDTVNTPAYFKGVAVDTKIEFCLAQIDPWGNPTDGITRHFTTKKNFHYIDDDAELKTYGYWPAEDYLNIWVTSVIGPGDQTVLGYAQFPDGYRTGVQGLPNYKGPETDGVVIDYRFFGNQTGTATNPYYSYGRTTTHEVGHYLGLLHTFNNFKGRCFSDADYCNDTPVQDLPTSSVFTTCPTDTTSCGAIKMFQNYMDYTQDQCMNIFTQDQKDRMRTILVMSESRNTLLNSPGCCPQTMIGAPVTFYDDFEGATSPDDNWDFNTTIFPGFDWQLNRAQNNSLTAFDNNAIGDTAVISSKLIFFTKDIDYENPTLRYDFSYSELNTSATSPLLEVQYDLACQDNWKAFVQLNSSDDIENKKALLPYTPNEEDYQTFVEEITPNISEHFRALRFRFLHVAAADRQVHLDNVFVNPNATSSKQFRIYPNPSNGWIKIEVLVNQVEEVELSIYNIQGKKLNNFQFNLVSATYDYDLSELPSGIYILEATIGGQIIKQKLAIQK